MMDIALVHPSPHSFKQGCSGGFCSLELATAVKFRWLLLFCLSFDGWLINLHGHPWSWWFNPTGSETEYLTSRVPTPLLKTKGSAQNAKSMRQTLLAHLPQSHSLQEINRFPQDRLNNVPSVCYL